MLLGPGGAGRPGGAAPRGPHPAGSTFRQLGVHIVIGGPKTTGPVLSRRMEAGRSALCRLPHLPIYDRLERAISTLVTPLALLLRRPFTHVDFVAKRHDSWRFQHPFFASKKSKSFFRPTPRVFSSWNTTTSPFVAFRGAHIHPLFWAENCII